MSRAPPDSVAAPARARRLARAFWGWYASCLVLALGTVGVAVGLGPPKAASAEGFVATSSAMILPPKPDPTTPEVTPGVGTGSADRYTPERCQKLPAEYAEACWSALARQAAERDPAAGLASCERVTTPALRFECVADVAEGHSRIDVAWSRATCDTIADLKWRDQCVFGIANAFARPDAAFALATCEDAGQFTPFCRHDVNGERATVDVDGALAFCAGSTELQDWCFHGVGKYLGRVDVAQALATCDRVPTTGDLRGQCVHGVGWAAAEARSDAAVDVCEGLGVMRDSCLLGVAYHHKRYDAARAARLCELAGESTERRRCLDFVRRGQR